MAVASLVSAVLSAVRFVVIGGWLELVWTVVVVAMASAGSVMCNMSVVTSGGGSISAVVTMSTRVFVGWLAWVVLVSDD